MSIHRRRPARGFTLIECAIVLALVAVLARLAAPSLARRAAAAAVAAQSAEFLAALRFARAEAVARGERVTLCAVAGPAAAGAPPACQPPAAATDWRAGWMVFVDRGHAGVLEAGDLVLRSPWPLRRSGGVAGTRAAISFTAAGFATDAAARLAFQPPAGAAAGGALAVLVCVSKQGQARVADAGACS